MTRTVTKMYLGPVVAVQVKGQRKYAFHMIQAGQEQALRLAYEAEDIAEANRGNLLQSGALPVDSDTFFVALCESLHQAYEQGYKEGQEDVLNEDKPPVSDPGQNPPEDTLEDKEKPPEDHPMMGGGY